MGRESGTVENTTWPMPKFRFEVDLGTKLTKIAFQEVSGLDVETQIIEYRASNSPLFSTIKMPGIVKNNTVTLKRGIFLNDNSFWDWHAEIRMNTIKRRDVIIRLIDEKGETTMMWTLQNVQPTKITSTELRSDGNEVSIDTIEITYEQISISNGS